MCVCMLVCVHVLQASWKFLNLWCIMMMAEWSYVNMGLLEGMNFIDLCSTKLLIPCHCARRKHGQSPSWALQLLWLHSGQPATENWTLALTFNARYTYHRHGDMDLPLPTWKHASNFAGKPLVEATSSRLDLCHLSTPSCFRQLFQQHIMLPLCLHLGRNHLVQGLLHGLLLLKKNAACLLKVGKGSKHWSPSPQM